MISIRRLSCAMALAACVVAASAIAASSASANCFKVAAAGTGTFEKATCEGAAGTKEYIQISKLETKLKVGEWCGKVETAKTGKYSNAGCTEEKAGATEKEYLKVLVVEPPEFFHELRCEKLATKMGRYTNATCTTESAKMEGEFEAHGVKAVASGSKIKFTDVSGESSLAVTSPKITIICKKDTSSGEITGPKTVGNVQVKFKECKEGTVACKSVEDKTLKEGTIGATEEIVTNTLTGTLKGTASAPEETLEPTLGSGHDFTFIKCGTVEGAVRGAVSGAVSPVEKLRTTGTLTFSAATGLTFAGSASTLTSKDEITFEEAIEVT